MILLKTIRNRQFRALLKLKSPLDCRKNPILPSLISSNSSDSWLPSSLYRRPFSISAQNENKSEGKSHDSRERVSVFFKEAVGISERVDNSDVEAEDDGEHSALEDKLRNLEEEVRNLSKNCEKGTPSKPSTEKRGFVPKKGEKRSLRELFSDRADQLVPTDFGNEDPMVHRELSPDMQMLVHHLNFKGYFKDASFLNGEKFDVTRFQVSYAREFLKFVAVKFGKDHQEIAKWLSASDLKKIALFGCPSLGKRSVNAAKYVRRFFEIDEHTVCRKCTLQASCRFANKLFRRKDSNNLHMDKLMRLLVMYAMESVPEKLVVPEEINAAVSRLLKEVINLSQTVP